MGRAQRKKQIEEIQAARNGRRVIVYVTGDRQPNLGAQIAFDVFPMMFELLSKIGPVPVLDLFIYSTGGMTMAAWGLANLLREFADTFSVLIPFRALSTATLIALGANEIVMSRLGQLSPVDPSVNTPFNPPAPQQPGAPQGFLPVSVEDVRGFLDLARSESEGNLKSEEALAEVFSRLAADVRPMALGNVYRAKEQIKLLTEQLLKLHIPEGAHSRIAPIVETFTRKRFSHDYLIGRKEAKRIIGPEVVDAPLAVEMAMMALYKSYAEDMELSTIFNTEGALGNAGAKVVSFRRAYLESTDGCYVFKTTQHLQRVQLQAAPNMPPVMAMPDQWEMAGNGKTNTVIIEGEMFMATPNQIVWTGSTGLFVVPQNAESTAKPFTPSEVTGGTITYASAPVETFVSAEEQEFASLLVKERKSLARKRIKPAAVNKAIKQVRYRR